MKRLVLLVFAALVLSGCDQLNSSPTEPSGPMTGNAVSYTAIGASDAAGVGSSSPCVPFVQTDCPDGRGYVPDLVRQFKGAGKQVHLLNLGVPGTVLNAEIQDLGNQLDPQAGLAFPGIEGSIPSNFLDNQAPFVAKDSTLVTVFAGGNDANVIGRALRAGLGGSNPEAFVGKLVADFGRDAKALVATVQDRAPQARIVVLNLPNLAALPYAAGYSASEKAALQEIAVDLSAQLNALTSTGALVVDVMCDPGFYQANLFSGDGFHPNDAGYARMASVIYPVATTGVSAAPQASCGQMRLY
jgi:lysophospholipase L1-like esterase